MTCEQGDVSLYAGPASSYFSFAVPIDQRMTDEQWQKRVIENDLPPRPDFARAYWVD